MPKAATPKVEVEPTERRIERMRGLKKLTVGDEVSFHPKLLAWYPNWSPPEGVRRVARFIPPQADNPLDMVADVWVQIDDRPEKYCLTELDVDKAP